MACVLSPLGSGHLRAPTKRREDKRRTTPCCRPFPQKRKNKRKHFFLTCQENQPASPRGVADKGARADEARPLVVDVVAVDEHAHGRRRCGARGVGRVVGADRGAGDGVVVAAALRLVQVGDREAPWRRGEREAKADRREELCARHLVEDGFFPRRCGSGGGDLGAAGRAAAVVAVAERNSTRRGCREGRRGGRGDEVVPAPDVDGGARREPTSRRRRQRGRRRWWARGRDSHRREAREGSESFRCLCGERVELLFFFLTERELSEKKEEEKSPTTILARTVIGGQLQGSRVQREARPFVQEVGGRERERDRERTRNCEFFSPASFSGARECRRRTTRGACFSFVTSAATL